MLLFASVGKGNAPGFICSLGAFFSVCIAIYAVVLLSYLLRLPLAAGDGVGGDGCGGEQGGCGSCLLYAGLDELRGVGWGGGGSVSWLYSRLRGGVDFGNEEMIGVARVIWVGVFVCRGVGEFIAIIVCDCVSWADGVWSFAFRFPSGWEAFDMEVEVGSALGEFFDFGACHGCVDGGGAG